LENLNFNEQAQKNANLAVALGGGGDVVLGQSFGTLAEQEQRAIEFVRKNELSKDQKINDETLRRVKVMFDEKKAFQRQKDAELSDQITSEILAGKIQTQDALRADPRFPSLDGSTQARLLKVYEKDGNIERPEVLQAAQAMAFSDNLKLQDAFKKLDLSGKQIVFLVPRLDGGMPDSFTVDSLTQKEFKWIFDLKQSFLNKDQNAREQAMYNDKKTTHQLSQEKVDLRIIRKGEQQAQYQQRLEQEINVFESAVNKGKPATPQDKQRIADDLAKTILIEGKGLFGGARKTPVYTIPIEDVLSEKIRISYDKIDATDVRKIEKSFEQSQGRKPSKQEVEYVAGKMFQNRVKEQLIPLKK
jgi:hypothetical protein